MPVDDLLQELEANYANRDPLKARIVVESCAGHSAPEQQAVVDLIMSFESAFSVPLFGCMLDLQLRDLALPRLTIARYVAEKLMQDPAMINALSRDAQIHVITALGEMNDEQALKPLRILLVSAPVSPNVRFTIYEALSKLPMTAGGYMLAAGLQDDDDLVRVAAARAIERNLSPSLAQGVINLLSEPAPLPEQIVAAVSRAGAFKTLEALLADDGFAGLLGKYLKTHNEAEFLAQLSPILYNTGRQALLAQVGAALSQTDDSHLPLIYVVDDSKVVLKMFEASLIPMGCRVKSFDNPFEAIEWVEKSAPDLLFTDLNMPEISGIELASTLRSNGGVPDFPIVMVTTQGFGDDIEQALLAGVDTFIQKPFTSEELADAINQLTDFDVAPPP
jgi:CheY-like chemotaxis protein